MKKFLFLVLGLAVSASAIAGVPAMKNAASSLTQSKRVTMQVNAPAPVLQLNHGQQLFSKAPIPEVKGQQPQALKAIVTEQPAGDVAYYTRSGNAMWLTADGSLYVGEQQGYIMVVTDGNTVWFKNLLYDPDGLYGNYWIKGTKSGSTITITLPQDVASGSIAYEDAADFPVQLRWGATTVSSGSVSGTVNTRINSRTFTVADDGSMTLNNATYTAQGVGNGLMSFFTYGTTNYFDYCMIYNTTFTYLGTSIPDTPTMYTDADIDAMTGDMYKYNRYGDAMVRMTGDSGAYLDIVEQGGTNYLFFDEDGSTVYMRDPVYGYRNGTWIKGTVNGDQLTFPLGQYIYWNNNFLGLKTSWGQFVNGEGYTNNDEVTEVSFTMGDGVITMNNAGVANYDENADSVFTLVGMSLLLDSAYTDPGWFGCLDFFTQYYDIPTVPTDLTVDPGSTTAATTWADDDDHGWNLRYREVLAGTENNQFWGFEEDNNDNETTELTAGWTTIDADGDGNAWYHLTGSSFNVHDGIGHVTSASYAGTALTPDNWLVSPAIALDGTLSFWAAAQDASWSAEKFAVYVNVGGDPTDPAAFTMISDQLTATAEMTQYTYDLTGYAGATGYVAIRHYDCTDQFRLNIDDIAINVAEPAEWTNVNGLTETAYNIEGLTPVTTYEVQVQAANNGGVSAWTESNIFTTLEEAGLRGDVNLDKQVNIADVTDLINCVLNNNWEGFSYDNADCDPNGTVNISDITALINYLLNNKVWPDE
jgi:hypothetical protein